MKTPLRKLMRPFTGALFLIVFVSLAMLSRRTAFAEEKGCCWFDAKTGKQVGTAPVNGANFGGRQAAVQIIEDLNGSRNNAYDLRTGRNYYRDANGCWFDSKTGKQVGTAPVNDANFGGSQTAVQIHEDLDGSRNSAFDAKTGRNYFRGPCPPPKTTQPMRTAQTAVTKLQLRSREPLPPPKKAPDFSCLKKHYPYVYHQPGMLAYDPDSQAHFEWDYRTGKWKNLKTGKFVECPEPETPEIKKQTGALFRTGEVQLNLFGMGGTGHGENSGSDTRTQTAIITETHKEHVNPNDPKSRLRDVMTTREMKVRHKTHNNGGPIQGGFGGAGAESKVFVTQNIGLGLEGDWLDGAGSFGTVMGTVTARFPMGSNAPYVFGGAGVQFGDETKAVGKLGGGIEHRFSPHCGVFVDAAWMFADHENAAVFRAGFSIVR